METWEYDSKLTPKPMPALGGLELDFSRIEAVENPNVRGVALMARSIRERLEADPSYEIQGAYSEAYSGERV